MQLILKTILMGSASMEKFNRKEFGDYQTPLFFTDTICEYLKNELKIMPEIIIEPTCGIGNFLKSTSEFFPNSELYGIEIDPAKLKEVDETIPNLTLINEDIFKFKFENIDKSKPILIIGNPPWATNTELSKLNSNNLPEKSNYRNEMAIDAMTGDSNFDISEAIIRKIVNECQDTTSTIALLCKTIVSRNLFKELIANNTQYSFIRQLNFNSSRIFRIDAEACLFVLQFGGTPLTDRTCGVSDFSNPNKILHRFGFKDDNFYSNINCIPSIDGECVFEWRQGVKHDCSSIMELDCVDGHLFNRNGDELSIETDLVYPLLKSSQVKKPIITETSKHILITQKRINQDTSCIKDEAPETWKYLNDNKEYFDKRKSSIYTDKPDFSIFGIGDYSFKKYKVAVSGFYKNPVFSLVYSDKPIMLDDTCYFLSFDNYDHAYVTMLILNTPLVKSFLKNIAFLDSKRPYTKRVLKRIDFGQSLEILSFNDLKSVENELGLENYLDNGMFDEYIKTVNGKVL